MKFIGQDLVHPVNRLRSGLVALAQNVRALAKSGFGLRSVLGTALYTMLSSVVSVFRLNDSTPNGPPSGYSLITVDSNGNLYCNGVKIAVGLSGNPVSFIGFRPNTSVQPWVYIGDSAADGNVTITTKFAINNSATTFVCSGMLKVRSDGLVYKTGIKEPQLAPVVTTKNTDALTSGTLLATTIPWTNYSGANNSYSYGETDAYVGQPGGVAPFDGTAPYIINVANATTVTITSLTGTAMVNGNASATPTTAGPSSSTATNPGHYTMKQDGSGTTPASANPSVVIGAFCDGAGNVVAAGVVPLYIPAVVDVGGSIGVAITVPYGAQTFQVGINSTGNTFTANSGSFAIGVTVTTNALPSVLSVMGDVTAYIYPDSPSPSGPVGQYIWKNPEDTGSGPSRTTGDAAVITTGNSFIFDATFTSGIPSGPGIGNSTIPMTWFQLTPQEVVSGSYPLYSPALKGQDGNTQYANFNFCAVGNLYFPLPGTYLFTLDAHDAAMIGFGGGITVNGGAINGHYGQTKTVVGGYPIAAAPVGGTATFSISVPAAGGYPIEVDYDYWYHSGRILLLMGAATPGGPAAIIPPLPVGVRTNVSYAYKYRSSPTGALSNPSPVSTPEVTPVLANQVASLYSPDPQVDKVDYYRQDSGLANFTYVATGPNDDGQGSGVNTAITDSLTDIVAAGNPIMQYDDFEPFPSIDLPRSGTCTVSGGVITRVSGDYFNLRWLPGTIISIGTPTQLSYVFIARPTTTSIVTIPGVPDGTALVWNIAEPKLAAQPLPYLFGPTDNIVVMHGVGDPLRPGVDYWTKGNNFDSAPDTNQEDVTSPSEPLINGAVSGGVGILASNLRVRIIAPNQFDALETVTGAEGTTWTYRLTSISRGLYIPRCIAVSGGGLIFFRVEDGWHVSPGGAVSRSITDESLYSLFPHEGSTPVAVTRGGVTIYPPDDTNPQAQQASVVGQFMYWDYADADGNPHTLVFDIESMGWIWDAITPAITCHASDSGESVQGVLAGCADGTVRLLQPTGAETPEGIVLTGAIGGQGFQFAPDFTVEYSSNAAITLTPIVADEGNGSYAPNPVTLPSTGGALTKFYSSFSPAKWKLLQFKFSFTDPTALVFLQGFVVEVRDWGSEGELRPVIVFADSTGGEGSEP
jgi:hypothetical protein